jgi:hypothetical protein
VATQSKAWVCGRSLAGIVGPNPAGAWIFLSFVSVMCCHVEFLASGLSLVQRSHIECGVYECDREASLGEGVTRTQVEAPQKNKIVVHFSTRFHLRCKKGSVMEQISDAEE